MAVANRIKGITVKIGGETTKLQIALKYMDKKIKSTQSQLKGANKLLEPGLSNTKLLA